ncbi:MAG: hypothetical protein JW755_10335 [Candidatus Aminicenantes bacterium]|nr:hypothetical protein [Candidatus Aminicenantes bacterium]
MRQKTYLLTVVVLLGLIIVNCSPRSDKDLFSGLMEEMVELAEKKDMTGLMLYFDEDYSDFQGRRKKETREFLLSYLTNYSNPVIHVLGTKVDNLTPGEADIQTEVAISSGAAKLIRKLIKAALDNYRLKIRFVKNDGSWKVSYAEWRYVSLDELYPESYALLKKIFPGI